MEFACEAITSWTRFAGWFRCLWLVGSYSLFLLAPSWEAVPFWEFAHLPQVATRLLVVSHDPWWFCGVGCNLSLFIYRSIDLSPFPFFWMNLAKSLSILFIFSKNELLVYWSLPLFLCLYFIYFCFDLYDFFPSTNVSFRLSFLWVF